MSIPKDKLIDEDTLLREEDRAWSGPASNCDSTLKTANATNKPKPARRACKNCSCGLAETKTEPDSASPIITSAAKSSCGNVSNYYYYLRLVGLSRDYSAI